MHTVGGLEVIRSEEVLRLRSQSDLPPALIFQLSSHVETASRPPRICRFCPPATFEMAPALLRRDRFPCKRDKRQDESWEGRTQRAVHPCKVKNDKSSSSMSHQDVMRLNQACQRNKVEWEENHAQKGRSCAGHPKKEKTCSSSESNHNNMKQVRRMF